jgi:two-component system KDP operon response regulator KdpE
MNSPSAPARRVLIVDDDQYVVNFLTMFFKHKGFQVAVARNALEMERQFGPVAFDVVVLDIRLKDAEGTHLIPRIRELQASVPIVMLTGLGYDDELMNASLKAGANGYVSKTLPPEELFAAVLRAMGA